MTNVHKLLDATHYARLYFNEMIPQPLKPKYYTNQLGKTLFDYFVIIKFMQEPTVWKNLIFLQLKILIDDYSSDIELHHIGFPPDWITQLA